MVEIAISVAAIVAEYLVAPIARPFGYIWNYKTNFDNLKIEVRKLEGQRDTVQHSVDEARRNGEQIEQHVSDWLDRVKTMTDEVSEVNGENERADMKCFKGLCPNPKKRYQHSRKAVKKTEAVARLHNEGSFPKVSFRTVPEETWIPSYKGYMAFESRMSTLKNILDALSNPDVNMVGIYGTGGIGKTTLAREIAGHAEDKKLFNVVAFAEVGVKPNIKEIQQEIADKLGLTFCEESVPGRARSLRQRLKQEEKVLLVLDNIWEKLDLEVVGIPFGNDGEGCKLLLTGRILDVLLEMESQNNFEVGILDETEAWSLYEKKAGVCDHLQALAKDVALACGGLPIAIDSVAVALKNKDECEWKDALRKLTVPSTSNFEGVSTKTYSCIEISYDQLKEKELKSTFLLCCIMEDTLLEDLLAYGMGLCIFENVEAMEDARNRVNTLVRKLKDSSLLLDINNGTFSIHDVVRDVGRSMASRDGHMFTVANNYIPREWVDKDILKNSVGISLYNISKLPEEFECPELQFFYLRTTSEDRSRVPDNFFSGMPKLKVLHLAGLELYSVPNSIRLLVNLRTLYIENCNLRDVDFIGEFKQLEILRICGFYGSKVDMIPKEMCNLTGLRLLYLNDHSIRNIPPNVLSTFTRLEELYLLGDRKIKWEVEGVNILDELKHLKHLTVLEISIPDDSVLPKGRLVSNKLERYNIIIGKCYWYVFDGQISSRVVKLNLKSSSCSDDVQKFLSLLDTEGFPELEYLHVENSPCFRTVVDCLESESCHHFLFLQSLSLDSVLNLEMINNYPLKADSFRQLRTIEVRFCHKLKNILSFSTYRALPLLQKVFVSSCDNMEEIFAIRREEDINNIEGTDQIEFKHLSSMTLAYLPKLTSLCSINNNKDMSDTPTILFNQKVASSSLEDIEISKMDDLETIRPNQLCNDSFCNLNSLEINKCDKLLTIFQSNMLEMIARLGSLTICDCKLVEQIFDLQGIDFDESLSKVESRLQKLVINDLPKLKHIWNKDPQKILSFQKLNSVKIHRCMSLKYLFPVSIAKSLSELKQLDVCDCGVEEFVMDDQGEANVAATFVFPRITSLEFNQLPRLKTFYRGVHTSQWQNLKRLTMCGCDKVELFASELFNFQENNEGQSDKSVQPLFIVEKVTFPSLEEIEIFDSNNLKILWQKGAKVSFCNLKSVTVSRCNELLTIFQFNTHEGLSMPESLSVRDCNSVEVIFDLQEVNFEESHSRPVTNKLQELYISELPKLKHIWNKDPKKMFSFQKLNHVKVHHCMSLKYLFPVSIAESLSELEQLDVYDCGVEEFVVDDQGEANVAATFVFPRITSLKFNQLPRLKTFYCGVHTSQWQNLKRLVMCRCDKVELFASELFNFQENNEGQSDKSVQPLFIVEKVTFPCLEEIEIFQSNNVKILLQKGSKESFCNLKSVEVNDCNELLTIFQFNTLEGLSMPKLLTVTIGDCASVEEIFDLQKVSFTALEESPSRAVPCQLQELNLKGLPKLKHIWKKDPQAKLSFEELPMPESLRVWNCDSIEVIFDLQKVNFEESHSRPVTNQLQKLYLYGLPKLKHIWKKDPQAKLSFEELPMPGSLIVWNCDSIEVIFDLQKVNFEESHSRPVTNQLQELRISRLPKLKHIWKKDPQAELSFENVQEVKVSDCQSLKDIFPASITRSLLLLVKLDVENCEEVEEIVAKEVEAKEAARFVFPKVTSIRLNELPQLRAFYPGVHSSKWEGLKKLKVRYCAKIELLASQLSCFQENNIDISVQQPFFLVEKDSFPILEKLILFGESARMISQGQFSEELFCNLKFLEVNDDESVHFPLRILKRFRHLHELHLQSSSYKEIFLYEEDETHVGVDSKLDMVLSKLEKLTVSDCQNLIQLEPSSTCFQNLTVLMVLSCHGLKNLMTSSTAKSLVQLREMKIESCKSMVEVVAKGGDVTEDKIIFSKLRVLILGDLPSLSCFCSENYTFELPSLEETIVHRCPEMKYFSLGDITTPILQKVRRNYMVYYTLEGDLNTTIQKTHNSRVRDSGDLGSGDESDDDSCDLESHKTHNSRVDESDDDSCDLESDDDDLIMQRFNQTNDYRHILSSPTASDIE